jgi:hypothetical protein
MPQAGFRDTKSTWIMSLGYLHHFVLESRPVPVMISARSRRDSAVARGACRARQGVELFAAGHLQVA